MKVQDRACEDNIGELVCDGAYKYVSNFAVEINGERVAEYDSLDKLSKEWTDYEEPKEDYIRVIDSFIHYVEEADDSFCCDESVKKFEEKLKAWKRLKDKGFRFNAWFGSSKNIEWEILSLENESYIPRQICDDLDLLFGGEE